MAGAVDSPRVKLTETQSEVLSAIDEADEPLGMWEIAGRLGCERGRDLRLYRRIEGAVRSLHGKGVLAYKTSLAGSRSYFRADGPRMAVARLFARYGEAETAAEIVSYARTNVWIWPHLRRACLQAVAEEPDWLPAEWAADLFGGTAPADDPD